MMIPLKICRLLLRLHTAHAAHGSIIIHLADQPICMYRHALRDRFACDTLPLHQQDR